MHWLWERKPSAHAMSKLNHESRLEGSSRFSSELATSTHRKNMIKIYTAFENCQQSVSILNTKARPLGQN